MRERMVTRTVATGNYKVMAVNMDTLKVEDIVVKIPSFNTLSEKNLFTAIQNALPENYKYVMHEATGTEEVLYGMSESDFIKLAKILPPRTKVESE